MVEGLFFLQMKWLGGWVAWAASGLLLVGAATFLFWLPACAIPLALASGWWALAGHLWQTTQEVHQPGCGVGLPRGRGIKADTVGGKDASRPRGKAVGIDPAW